MVELLNGRCLFSQIGTIRLTASGRLTLGQLETAPDDLAYLNLGAEQLERLELEAWPEPGDQDERQATRKKQNAGSSGVSRRQSDRADGHHCRADDKDRGA